MYTVTVIAFIVLASYTAYKGALNYRSIISMDYDEVERFEKLIFANIFLLLVIIFYPEGV